MPPSPLACEHLVVVEGTDDKNFFEALLSHIGVEGYQVRTVEGKDNFKHRIPAFVKSVGFDAVQTLTIVRDADQNADGAFDSAASLLRRLSLPCPAAKNSWADGSPRVGVYIMPGDFQTGMLEDLFASSLTNAAQIACVDAFEDCVRGLDDPPRNQAKSKAQSILATLPQYTASIGIAAKKGYWDLDAASLQGLREFLSELV